MATTELSLLTTHVNTLLPAISDMQNRFRQLTLQLPVEDMWQLSGAMKDTSGIDRFISGVSAMKAKVQDGLQGLQNQLKSTGMADFRLSGLDNAFISAARSAIDFESQMAQVSRAVHFETPQQFAQMGEDILSLSDRLPVAAGEMTRLVQAAGQAGIPRDELTAFTEDAVKMGVVFGQSAEQSVAMMASWHKDLGLTQEEAVQLADKITAQSARSGVSPLEIAGNPGAVQGIMASDGDNLQDAGAMQQAYAQQTATTATQLQLLNQQATHAGIAFGNALLPQINAGTQALMPMIGAVTQFITANPQMVQSLAGAAAGFATMRLAIAGASMAVNILSSVANLSPVGLVVRGIAVAAGLLMANWETVGPFFQKVWDAISAPFESGRELMLRVLTTTPLGLVQLAWDPIVGFFTRIWKRLAPLFEFFTGEKQEWVNDLNAQKWGAGGSGIYDTGVPGPGFNPYQIPQPAGINPTGSLTVDFVNAPTGMRVIDTRAQGLDVKHNVGHTLYSEAAQATTF